MIKLLAAAALAFAATASQAATYVSSRTIGTSTANLSITTDDTLGTLIADNILDWSVVLTIGADTVSLFGPNSGDNSVMYFRGSALSATATNLVFDFTVPGQNYLGFQSTMGDRSVYCIQTVNCFDQTPGEIVSLGNTFTNFARVTRSGSVAFASTASVPEAATWAMLVAGFGVMGAAMRRRRAVSTTIAA
jgi:hypothetical protein